MGMESLFHIGGHSDIYFIEFLWKQYVNSKHRNKKAPAKIPGRLLRREGSNLRPSGYEPDELPLLYFAI